MASIRSTCTSSSHPATPVARTPSEAVGAIARESARVQLAAFAAAGKAFAGWARAADRLGHSIGDELLRRLDGETDSRQLFVAVVAAADVHIHDVTALPSAAVNHFEARLLRASANTKERSS